MAAGTYPCDVNPAIRTRSSPVPVQRALEWGTFLGGSGDDRGLAIDVSEAGGVYIAGATTSPRIQRPGRPVGPDLIYNDTHGNGRSPNPPAGDVLVAKISQTG